MAHWVNPLKLFCGNYTLVTSSLDPHLFIKIIIRQNNFWRYIFIKVFSSVIGGLSREIKVWEERFGGNVFVVLYSNLN